MLGSKSGLQKHVKEVAPNAKGFHCMIHRFALASKTFPDALCKILEAVVKCVNFVKAGDLNSRLFQNLCRGMDSEHETLLFYSKNWQRKVIAGNVAMFENLSNFLDEIEEDHLLDPSLKNEIIQHLKSLESELKRYFPEFEEGEGKLVRNPFSGTLDNAAIPDDGQDEFLDLRNDSAARDLYEEKSPTVFWCSIVRVMNILRVVMNIRVMNILRVRVMNILRVVMNTRVMNILRVRVMNILRVHVMNLRVRVMNILRVHEHLEYVL
ncbi:zinc finger BED domain-containing protein 5-like [Homarus americanus]|uniref:zinc finger BED domain-containing protein 5-like n=1 Tax=Homarus americanus TaxID=6706 RepID=UPI001C45A472|nr:zinc finger BED domain-containing protein 5-like [Homarus americanus]